MFKIDENEDVRALAIEPKIADRKTGEQKTERDTGVPLWTVTALHQQDDGAPELIKVTIASPTEPEFSPMLAGFTDLEAGIYTIKGDGGGLSNAGLFFRASALVELAA